MGPGPSYSPSGPSFPMAGHRKRRPLFFFPSYQSGLWGRSKGPTQLVSLPEPSLCLLDLKAWAAQHLQVGQVPRMSPSLEGEGPLTPILGWHMKTLVGWPFPSPQEGKNVAYGCTSDSPCHVTGPPFCSPFSNLRKSVWSGNAVNMSLTNQLFPS